MVEQTEHATEHEWARSEYIVAICSCSFLVVLVLLVMMLGLLVCHSCWWIMCVLLLCVVIGGCYACIWFEDRAAEKREYATEKQSASVLPDEAVMIWESEDASVEST